MTRLPDRRTGAGARHNHSIPERTTPMTRLALILSLALALPAHAGGPVIIEDPAEAAPLVRSHDNRLVPILFGIAVAAILLGGGSDSPCNGDEPTPEPGGC